MKRIAVIATDGKFAGFLMQSIQRYMHRYAEFTSYSMAEIEGKETIEEDFILLSAFTIYQKVREKIGSHAEVIILTLALNKRQIQALKKIPEGTRALLVNFDNRSCMHTITCIYDAGIRGLELYPYYGEGDYDHTVKVAITPDEAQLVPADISEVYDIGQSSIDMASLYDLADKLGVYEEFSANEANEAKKEYYQLNSSMDRLLNEKESMTDKLNTLLKLMNEGIIITDSLGRIYMTNDKADRLLAARSRILRGFEISEILPEVDLGSTKEKLIKTPGANLVASAVDIRSGDEVAGHIVTVTDFTEDEEKQHGIRAKLSETSHTARYHFDDILGGSPAITAAVNEARRMADSDAAVMITGESGSGKELFAQSIHNASARRKYNFVAVNCAAIPDNLLESEMFGYEEGSFTGARKGGRMGFFELAHRGTIFLDEIGELPLQLQSKLLRVLEEKKVMRVGSNRNIDIDVRIIAATNQDLFAMMERGEFREDLYYRLNVLPLSIPPLRARREDILPIFYALSKGLNATLQLSPEASAVLENHSWRGNVRELRNVAEYLASKGKKYIEAEDLPVLHGRSREAAEEPAGERSTVIDKFLLNEGREIDLYHAVLRQLRDSLNQGERFGRRKLLDRVNEYGGAYTEGEVRKALAKLSAYGFARSAKGRGGSMISRDGLQLLAVIERIRERGSVI